MNMIIDVSNILKEVGASKEFEGGLPLEDMIYQGEKIGFLTPVNVSGSITNVGEFLILNANANVKLQLQCSSCAQPFDSRLKFDLDAKLKKVEDPDDPDIFVYDGNSVDLRDIVLEYLLLALPIRKQCCQECKGLCPYCGCNLNEEQCNCELSLDYEEEYEVDSRLEALKNVLTVNGEEV